MLITKNKIETNTHIIKKYLSHGIDLPSSQLFQSYLHSGFALPHNNFQKCICNLVYFFLDGVGALYTTDQESYLVRVFGRFMNDLLMTDLRINDIERRFKKRPSTGEKCVCYSRVV